MQKKTLKSNVETRYRTHSKPLFHITLDGKNLNTFPKSKIRQECKFLPCLFNTVLEVQKEKVQKEF